MAFLIENNSVSRDSYGTRMTRLSMLEANIDTYALELSLPLDVQTWANGASAAWQTALSTQTLEQGQKFESFQTSQESDAALLEQFVLLKELIVARYGDDDDMLYLFGCKGETPQSHDDILNRAYDLITNNAVQIAAADPKALPASMTDNLKTLADASRDDYTAAIKERREATQSTKDLNTLFQADSEQLRNLYQWACAIWGKFDTRLIELGFVPATKHGGGYPAPPANLTFTEGTNTFSWDAVPTATSYQLVYKKTVDSDWIDAYTGSDTSFAFNPGDGIWEFKVRSRNANGFSDWSATIEIQLPNSLSPPSNVTVVHEVGSIRRNVISFDVPVGATLIDVYVSIVPLGDPEGAYNLDGTFDALSPIIRPVGTGLRFWYYLIARNGTQSSLESTHVYVDAN